DLWLRLEHVPGCTFGRGVRSSRSAGDRSMAGDDGARNLCPLHHVPPPPAECGGRFSHAHGPHARFPRAGELDHAPIPHRPRQSFTPRYSHHLEPEQGRTLEHWMIDQLQTHRAWPESPRVMAESHERQLSAIVICDHPEEVSAVQVLMARGSKRPQTRFWRT